MGFFDRLSRGWEISMSSYKVLLANKQLIIFPILSGLSMLLIFGSIFGAFFAQYGLDLNSVVTMDRGARYFVLFLFYIINYFVVVFFNMALIHCARLYFEGEEVSVSKGLQFSVSRLGAIFSWAVFAATVGTVLKLVQDNAGWLGKILISIVGFVWSLATFFVVPIIAYENVGPVDALKRSSEMMKEKWGERLGASFSIALLPLLGMALFGILGLLIGNFINETAGIMVFVAGILLVFALHSALNSIFISAVYHNINGNFNDHYNQQLLDGLFVERE